MATLKRKREIDSCTIISDEDELEAEKTPPKTTVKKQRRLQTFRDEYSVKYPTLRPGKKSSCSCLCCVCESEFSIAHGGGDDCRRHIESRKHKENEKKDTERKKCAKISGFFVPSTSTKQVPVEKDDGSIRAEVMLVDFVTELNLPFSSLDKFTKVLPAMFPDSKIAKGLQCGRSKGTAILKEISAKTTVSIAKRLKTQPFTVSTDGSNDVGTNKLFPLVVRTYDSDLTVRSEVLALPKCDGSATGKKICQLITTEFEIHNIPPTNCLALGADNAPVMAGSKEGCYGNFLKSQPQAYFSGCVCHLIHIGARKGASCLPLDVGQLLIDLYYYLDKSSKRQHSFKKWQLLHELKEQKIIKHVNTRWLSIQKCLPRVIESWDALYSFFKEEEKNAKGSAEKSTTGHLKHVFQSKTSKAYCIFLLDALEPFMSINTMLQTEQPLIQCTKSLLLKFFRQILVRFVKPSALLYKSASDVDLDQACNIKDDKEILLGNASDTVTQLKEEKKKEFLSSARKFYLTSAKYLKAKLPFQDELLQHAEVADPAKQLEAKFSSVAYFLRRFPCMLPEGASAVDVEKEFLDYQSTDIRHCIHERVDQTWGSIFKMVTDGEKCFEVLPKVMAAVLCIPHSSAHCERVFSQVRKVSNDSRSSMGNETLQALMVNKGRPGSVLDRSYKPQDYADFKSAYTKSLKMA